MASTPKILAEGQLGAAKGTLYTVATSRQVIMRTVSFNHVAGGTQTVILYVKKSGSTSRQFSRAILLTNEFAHEEDIGTLDAGDSIEAQATDASSVDYTVMGVEVAA